VEPVQAAASDVDGAAQFFSEGTTGSLLVDDSTRASVGARTDVKVLSFKTIVDRWGPPTFCKIDIEGAEVRLLAAAPLASLNTHFAIDTDHIVDGRTTADRVESTLRAAGYTTATSRGTTLARRDPVAK
jgi:hypothetical protein